MSEPPDLETLARRYLDLRQDQDGAWASGRECPETIGRLLQVSATLGPAGWMSLWTAAAAGLKPQKPQDGRPTPSSPSSTSAKPGPAAAPRPAAAAAAHHDGGHDVAELRRRLAALEARLAELDRPDAHAAGAVGPGHQPDR